MTLLNTISSIFNDYAIKTVSKTDKVKKAYVLNNEQVKVIKKAGVKPSKKRPADSFRINVLGDKERKYVNATYYHSVREGSGRTSEPRLGTEIINDWLNKGDKLILATDGSEIFAAKLNNNSLINDPPETAKSRIVSELSDAVVKKRARKASRKPKKSKSTTEVYIGDVYVKEVAKRRAKGKCEMPGCKYKAFITENNRLYFEGHHVIPLAEGGDDVVENVAALCPICHREQHYAKDRFVKRKKLQKILIKKLKS